MIDAALQLSRPGFVLDAKLRLPGTGVSALFGPSGCGKTTLLRTLAGLERARGRLVVDGEVWQNDERGVFVPPHARPLGYVIQEAALFPHLSVADNVAYGRRRSGAAAGRVALDAVVDLLGIGALMSRRPATLSGGERQRVAIARALATGPRLLLMDEPLAALDAPRKAEILPYLERLHRSLSMPIVYVTHAMDEVARLADHLVLLEAGQVRASGPLAELLTRPDLPLARPDDAGVVIDATVLAHDRDFALTQIGFAGGTLWVGESSAPVGARVRARVLARDVSVARAAPTDTSIVNLLPARLLSLQSDRGTSLLQLGLGETGGTPLLARITRRSAETLALAPGDTLIAQVKGVALMAEAGRPNNG